MRITSGDAARRNEEEASSTKAAFSTRIEGGTAARRSEAETKSSVVRSAYAMKISGRVGLPFTLEDELSGPGERKPVDQRCDPLRSVTTNREVVLSAKVHVPAALANFDEVSVPDAERLHKEQGRFHTGVSSLKALLPRGWFTNQSGGG